MTYIIIYFHEGIKNPNRQLHVQFFERKWLLHSIITLHHVHFILIYYFFNTSATKSDIGYLQPLVLNLHIYNLENFPFILPKIAKCKLSLKKKTIMLN